MGFLKHLLFWPVTGPLYLTEFSLGKVQGVVQDQLTDDTRVKESLLDLQMRLELGEIDDAEYAAEEERLMYEMREVRRWREHYGMATRGGVVQVADEREEDAEDTEIVKADAPQPTVHTGKAELEISIDFGDEQT
jgi:hypothetical protein